MKPLAAILGAGGITTAAEAEKINEHRTILFIRELFIRELFIRELKYVLVLSIKLPFFENVVRIEALETSY
tara:strand:- start:117 stop:329 length:213 start_codon:yes stop_codon:yes gene_type:complete